MGRAAMHPGFEGRVADHAAGFVSLHEQVVVVLGDHWGTAQGPESIRPRRTAVSAKRTTALQSSATLLSHFAWQRRIQTIRGTTDWSTAQSGYREVLFGTGAFQKPGQGAIPLEQFKQVLKSGGKLPLATVLRCRVRYFTDGAVLGTKAFVETHLAAYRQKTGRRQRTAPRPLPAVTDWGELATLRGLRKSAVG